MRALTSFDRHTNNVSAFSMEVTQVELFARITAFHFESAGHPQGGWSGDENPWDASDYVRKLVDALSAYNGAEATEALHRLAGEGIMSSYIDSIKHALTNQRARYREMNFRRPSWAEAIATLCGGRPANVADMHALVIEHLREISRLMGTQNNDAYKEFWNEDPHGRPTVPKVEESARDVLLGLLRARLGPLDLIVEPEGHMVTDKRADMTVAMPGGKLVIELKRDIHPELWSAPETQLDRFYTRDPEASGYGVYGVFWYGRTRRGVLPKNPSGGHPPKTALELESMLNVKIDRDQRTKLRAVVIDVSVPDGQRAGAAKKRKDITRQKMASKKTREKSRSQKKATAKPRSKKRTAGTRVNPIKRVTRRVRKASIKSS
jgi:hypothetical protein